MGKTGLLGGEGYQHPVGDVEKLVLLHWMYQDV